MFLSVCVCVYACAHSFIQYFRGVCLSRVCVCVCRNTTTHHTTTTTFVGSSRSAGGSRVKDAT